MQIQNIGTIGLVFILLAGLVACASEAGKQNQVEIPDPPLIYAGKTNPLNGDTDALAQGQKTYAMYCASCHGDTGKSDGPAATSLNPKPPDMAARDWSLTRSDAYIYWRIAEGGIENPFNSAMPAWKSLLTEDQVWQLVVFLRSFSQ